MGPSVLYYRRPNARNVNPIPTLPMRVDSNLPTAAFAARIAREDKAALEAYLPMHGGRTWWMERALEHFCDRAEADPKLAQYIRDKILLDRESPPPQNIEEFLPRIARPLYNRFNQLFPDKGATTWFIRRTIRQYLDIVQGRPSHEEFIQLAVNEVIATALAE